MCILYSTIIELMKMIYFTYYVTKQMNDTIFLYVYTKYKCLVIVVL